MQAVPYKGGATVATAIAAGEVPVGMLDTAAIMPMIANKQAVAIGITEPERARTMPDIPTLREAGVPNFSASSWLAIFAPGGEIQRAVDCRNDRTAVRGPLSK